MLISTGSKELHLYTRIKDYKERCFARVLSTQEAVAEAVRLGFEGKHLIAMQGPYSEELNLAMLKHINAAYFVTKESGGAGGFEEKKKAAQKAQTGANSNGPVLYNLATDPGETKDVAAEHPEIVTKLQAEAARRETEIKEHRRPAGQLSRTK